MVSQPYEAPEAPDLWDQAPYPLTVPWQKLQEPSEANRRVNQTLQWSTSEKVDPAKERRPLIDVGETDRESLERMAWMPGVIGAESELLLALDDANQMQWRNMALRLGSAATLGLGSWAAKEPSAFVEGVRESYRAKVLAETTIPSADQVATGIGIPLVAGINNTVRNAAIAEARASLPRAMRGILELRDLQKYGEAGRSLSNIVERKVTKYIAEGLSRSDAVSKAWVDVATNARKTDPFFDLLLHLMEPVIELPIEYEGKVGASVLEKKD